MKTKHFILTSLAVLAGFASCQQGSGNEEPTPQPQPQPSIVGTWTYRDVTCEVEAADSLANIAKTGFYLVKLSNVQIYFASSFAYPHQRHVLIQEA